MEVCFILTHNFATAISWLGDIVVLLKHGASLIDRIASFVRFYGAQIWTEPAFNCNIIAASTFALFVAETVVYLHWQGLFFRNSIFCYVFHMNVCWTLVYDTRSTDDRVFLIIFVIWHFFRCQNSCHIKLIIILITIIFNLLFALILVHLLIFYHSILWRFYRLESHSGHLGRLSWWAAVTRRWYLLLLHNYRVWRVVIAKHYFMVVQVDQNLLLITFLIVHNSSLELAIDNLFFRR